jgi:hypothetical protein
MKLATAPTISADSNIKLPLPAASFSSVNLFLSNLALSNLDLPNRDLSNLDLRLPL